MESKEVLKRLEVAKQVTTYIQPKFHSGKSVTRLPPWRVCSCFWTKSMQIEDFERFLHIFSRYSCNFYVFPFFLFLHISRASRWVLQKIVGDQPLAPSDLAEDLGKLQRKDHGCFSPRTCHVSGFEVVHHNTTGWWFITFIIPVLGFWGRKCIWYNWFITFTPVLSRIS